MSDEDFLGGMSYAPLESPKDILPVLDRMEEQAKAVLKYIRSLRNDAEAVLGSPRTTTRPPDPQAAETPSPAETEPQRASTVTRRDGKSWKT